jgi:uncharacterized membrane protein YhaH (DUF805 family)
MIPANGRMAAWGAAMDWTAFFFRFNGRINRAKYWFAALIYTLVLIALVVAFIMALGDFDKDRIGEMVGTSLLFIAVGGLVFLVLLWSSFATAIKRLHDRNKSGWWVLVFWVLPAIVGAVADGLGGTASLALNAVSVVLSVWGFVEVGCLRGTQGPNEYGPDPLGAPAVAPAAS